MNDKRLFSLFETLCQIDTPPLAERESVEWTKTYLQKIGLEVWEDNAATIIGGNANNLIAKLPANQNNAPNLFFSAHFDTVEPTNGLEIGLENGRYFSKSDTILGADDKAGMAPAIEAVNAIAESDEPHGDIYLVLCVAEEIGLKGAFACDIQNLGVDFGYVFDTGPPVGSFVNKVGTHDRITAKIIGRPAHAGKHPEEGINAIQAASIGIAKMKLGRIDEVTTVNVGQIRGGTATNVVPAETVFEAEARSLEIHKLDQQVEHMVNSIIEGAQELGAQTQIKRERNYTGYHIPENERVIQIAQNAARQLGFSGELRWTLGGSDANAFNSKGVPSIVCGTGMQEIHTHDENVSQKDLVDLTRLAIEIVRTSTLTT